MYFPGHKELAVQELLEALPLYFVLAISAFVGRLF